jgi:hypothetical protein
VAEPELLELKPANAAEQSVYSPIKDKAEELKALKIAYNNMLITTDFSSHDARYNLITKARLLYDNDDLFSTQDNELVMSMIGNLETLDYNIVMRERSSTASMYSYSQENPAVAHDQQKFKNSAHDFLKEISRLLKKYGSGTKTRKDIDAIGRLYLALRAKARFDNSFGIPISPQMEVLARALHIRALNEFDNIVTINSNKETGLGKTTFALALATTYAYHMTGLGWDWNYNLVINEDKEYVTQLFSHMKKLDIVQLDESGNQGNKKTWWDTDQIDFMNYMTRLRVHGITTLVIWPDTKEIDSGISGNRAAINITINERGLAIVRGLNRNPYIGGKEYIPYGVKNEVALTGAEAQTLMQERDMLNVFEVPFYPIPEAIWAHYSLRKEDSLKVSALSKRYKRDRFQTASDMYTKFFQSIPPTQVRITAQEVKKFGQDQGYMISFKKVADQLALGTGRRAKDLVQYEAIEGLPIDINEIGWISVDEYMHKYLDRLQSMKLGSQATKP